MTVASVPLVISTRLNEFALKVAVHAEHDTVADLEIPRYRYCPPVEFTANPDMDRLGQIQQRRMALSDVLMCRQGFRSRDRLFNPRRESALTFRRLAKAVPHHATLVDRKDTMAEGIET